MERAATLIRVSSDTQDETNQIREVDAHCQVHDYKVVKPIRLHDVSASGEQVRVLDQILADIRAGEYTVVVAAHSSRVDRREPDEQLLFLLNVRMAGGRIESAREPDYGKADIAGMIRTLMSQHENHDYSVTLKGHMAAAKTTIKDNGAFDGKPPWGFTTIGEKYSRRLLPTELGLKYVPLIYGKVIAGVSLSDIAKWLTDEGVPPMGVAKEDSPKGKTGQWWPRSVLQLVRNPVYKGHRSVKTGRTTWGKTVHRCTPIVDADTWQRAQKALKTRPKRGPVVENRAMLATAIFCGNPDCTAGPDSPMYRITPPPRGERVWGTFYRCSGRGANKKGCGTMANLNAVDAAVNTIIAEAFDTPYMVRKLVPGNSAELDAQLEEIKSDIRELDIDDDNYDIEHAKLLKLHQEIKNMERTPDEVKLIPSGDTYAGLYASLTSFERGPWLASQEFRVTASKTAVTVTQRGVAVSMPL